MATITLTPEQETFLEECALEFSDRFTDADLDYKKIYDLGIPTPPIMSPWYGRGRFNRDRDRGEGRYNDRRDNRDYRSDNYRDRNYYKEHSRYRPY